MTRTESPFKWIKNAEGKHECHYQAQRGDIILGTIERDNSLTTFNLWHCRVNTGLIDDIKIIEQGFIDYEHAKEFVESGARKKLCTECKEMHEHNAFCDCGACLYENGKSQNDPNYPFFTCGKCKRTCFWD